MTAGWGARTVRAAVLAAVCVLLAALGHVMMSGDHVPWWALAAGLAATSATGWGLAGRERGLPLVVSVVVGAQTVLHSWFSLAQAYGAAAGQSAGDAASMDMTSMGHDMSSLHISSPQMGSPQMGSPHTDHLGHTAGGSSSLGMFAAHLLAALLCGLWLAYGERAAFRILRAVGGWLAAPLRLLLAVPVPPHHPRVHVRHPREDQSPRRLLLVHAVTSRGPPVGTAVI